MSENFIQIGETRIKKSNIKNFGVSSERLPETQVNAIDLAFTVGVTLVKGVYNKIKHGAFFSEKNATPRKTHREYLYVTTYQNDNFKFYDDQINIYAAVRQLEKM